MALELADLREDMDAKYLYEKNDLIKFWLSIDEDKYSGLKGEARKVLVRMGTMYICEAGFSHMTYIKSKHRARITNEHLNNYLIATLTSYTPRYQNFVRQKDNHCD